MRLCPACVHFVVVFTLILWDVFKHHLFASKVLHFVVDRWHIKWYRLREGKSASNNKNIVFFCESWIFLWLTIIPEIVTQSVDVAPITALQTTPVTSDTPILKPISGPRLGRLSVSVRVRGLGYWVVNRREREFCSELGSQSDGFSFNWSLKL